jgi:hypothetical protein
MLLRARSGAQINEQEYARLSKLVPSVTDPLPTFQAKLKDFRREAQSILSGSTGNQPARPRLVNNPPLQPLPRNAGRILMADREIVSLVLPSGEEIAGDVPAGRARIKSTYVPHERPDLFGPPVVDRSLPIHHSRNPETCDCWLGWVPVALPSCSCYPAYERCRGLLWRSGGSDGGSVAAPLALLVAEPLCRM